MRVFKVEKVKKDLAKALSATCSKEKSSRISLTRIYYDAVEKKLVSTNGRTMLIVDSDRFIPVDDEENGFFELIGDNLIEVSMNEKFPDWKRVVPSDGVINNYYSITPDKKFKAKTMAGMICLLTGYIFNLDDKEVTAGMELYSTFQSIGWNGNAVSAIKINGAGFMYILMPMAACLEKTFTKEEIQEKEAI